MTLMVKRIHPGLLGATLLLALISTRSAASAPIVTTPTNRLASSQRPAASRQRKHSDRPARSATELLDRLAPGTTRLPMENVEGVVLLEANLRGPNGRDTTGLLVLDTGSGYLGIDVPVAGRLGITQRTDRPSGVVLAEHSISRALIGTLEIDAISPVLLLDAEIIRRVTGRDALGLAGMELFRNRAVWIDYGSQTLTIIPSPPPAETMASRPSGDSGSGPRVLRVTTPEETIQRSRAVMGPLLSAAARPVGFRSAGDNKLLVRARFLDRASGAPGDWLTLAFDTGATKSVLFDPEFSRRVPASKNWRSVRGLVAPTLVGASAARLTLAPGIEIESADERAPLRSTDMDCAEVETPLSSVLSDAVGEPVVGLLGYSFFKGFDIGIDYTNHLIWLDPRRGAGDDRPFEYSHIGIQLEQSEDSVLVVGVAEGSPADRAGIRAGDQVLAIDGKQASASDLLIMTQALEGPPGTRVRLRVRRGGVVRSYVLSRERLL